MSKFCTNCGNQLEEQAAFCPNCGTACQATPEEAPAQPAAEATPAKPKKEKKAKKSINEIVADVTNFTTNYVAAAKKNKKLIIFPAAILAVVLAIIITVSIIINFNSYTGAIDSYIKMETGKANKTTISRMMPKALWEKLEDNLDMDIDDYVEAYKDSADERLDELEDNYGKNFKVTYKITDKDQLSKKDMKSLKESLKTYFDIDKSDVKNAYKLDIEWEIKGSEDSDDGEAEDVVVVQIGATWYLITAFGDLI